MRFYETGKMHTWKTSGRRRKTTREEDLNVVFAAIETPFRTRLEIREASGVDLALKTISKRLKENGIYSRVARINESLSAGHRVAKVYFAENFANFDELNNTVFLDEATFQIAHAVRTFVWRPIGIQTAFEEHYILPSVQSDRRSVSVFGIMSGRGLGQLFRIDGRFDGQKFVEILDNIVLPYIKDQFPYDHIFYYQDKSQTHRSRIATHWFKQKFKFWSAYSTPAEIIWY